MKPSDRIDKTEFANRLDVGLKEESSATLRLLV